LVPKKSPPKPWRLLRGLIGLGLLCALGACSDPGDDAKTGIYLDNAYIKTAVPGRTLTAAYATIINHDPEPLCLVLFVAPFAETIELHVTEPKGAPGSGQVRMRRIPKLCLEPGERAQLEPGGMHLMVMGLDRNSAPGSDSDPVAITLATESGRAFEGLFRVQPFNK